MHATGNNTAAGVKYSSAPQHEHINANGDVESNKHSQQQAAVPDTRDSCVAGAGMANNPSSKAKDITVLFKGDSGYRRRRDGLVKYLMAVCILLFIACLIFIVIAFLPKNPSNSGTVSDVCLTEYCVKTASQLLDSIDKNVDPCEDFFQYACGSWNRKHIIPEDKGSFNTFEKLHDDLQIKIKKLLEVEVDSFDTDATIKAKTLYASCMDTAEVERIGDAPMEQVLLSAGGWPVVNHTWDKTSWNLEKAMGILQGNYKLPSLLRMKVGTDDKNSSVRIIQLDQPTLGMPSREYYLDESESIYKQAYLSYMVNVAVLLGADKDVAESDMAQVLLFETQIANATTPQNERHDTGKLYNKLKIKDLMQEIPEVDWLGYFNAFMPMEITEEEPVVSFAVDYMKKMGELKRVTDKRVLANYLVWRLLMGLLPEMTESYQEVRNDYRKVLQGVSRDKVRWQKCVEYLNERMGMAVGRLFIRENFDENSKETALEMIHNIRSAFNEILEETVWMDKETKEVAKAKANAMNERIGYPEFIRDANELDEIYAGLDFARDRYFENILKVERHDSQKNLKKLREPVKKEKWEQDPVVVNAFYNPNTNDIVFPAGILQPLFYSQHFPKSLNYGGIGVVIGHEITHGFDDKGRQYDKNGNLRQWWNNETIRSFRQRAQCIIDQYSQYTLEPFGLHIDGKNTQGENIADNGGLKESFRAYRKWVSQNGEEPPLPGISLSHNQLFFLNYAQIWCGIMRDEEALQKIRTNVHSPGQIRVLGPLSNSHEFAEAYSCPAGSPMNPIHKCQVW